MTLLYFCYATSSFYFLPFFSDSIKCIFLFLLLSIFHFEMWIAENRKKTRKSGYFSKDVALFLYLLTCVYYSFYQQCRFLISKKKVELYLVASVSSKWTSEWTVRSSFLPFLQRLQSVLSGRYFMTRWLLDGICPDNCI